MMTEDEFSRHKAAEIQKLKEWNDAREKRKIDSSFEAIGRGEVRDTYGVTVGDYSVESNPYRER